MPPCRVRTPLPWGDLPITFQAGWSGEHAPLLLRLSHSAQSHKHKPALVLDVQDLNYGLALQAALDPAPPLCGGEEEKGHCS